MFPGDVHQIKSGQFDVRAPEFTRLVERLVDVVPIVYLVNGHSDTVADLWRITRGTGARVLDNEIETFELNGNLIHLAGVSLNGRDYEPAAWEAAERLAEGDLPGVRILLAHEPDAIRLLGGKNRGPARLRPYPRGASVDPVLRPSHHRFPGTPTGRRWRAQ